MSFKVLAAVLAICVAQNAVCANPLAFDKRPQHDAKGLMAKSEGKKCLATLMGQTFKLSEEGILILKDNIKLGQKRPAMERECQKLETGEERRQCMEEVDRAIYTEQRDIYQRYGNFILKILGAVREFGECILA